MKVLGIVVLLPSVNFLAGYLIMIPKLSEVMATEALLQVNPCGVSVRHFHLK